MIEGSELNVNHGSFVKAILDPFFKRFLALISSRID